MTGSSERVSRGRFFYAGTGMAVLASLLVVWTTIVRDDGNGIGFFLIVMAVAVAGFSASFRPAGMVRAMVGVAIMQALLGLAIATAPVTAIVPGASSRMLWFSGFYVALWLMSAACFGVAARRARKTAMNQ